MSVEQTVNAVVIYNPLDPTDRAMDKLLWREGATLADYTEGVPDIDWVIAVNGIPVDPGKIEVTTLNPDDQLLMTPVLHGGGGGKKILRVVAMLAIMVAAPSISAALVGTGAGSLGATTLIGQFTLGQAVTGAIAFAGNAILAALAPTPKPPALQAPTHRQNYQDSPSFGIDGPKSTAREDTPVPVVYGTFRIGGNRSNILTENDGKTQLLRIQQIVSEGPITEISDFQINGQSISNFRQARTQTRLGADNQNIMGWFDDTKVFHNIGNNLNETYAYYNTTDKIDKFQIDLLAAGGLVNIDRNSGNRRKVTVPVTIEYAPRTEINDWVGIDGSVTSTEAKNLEVTVIAYKKNGAEAADGTYQAHVQYRQVGASTWRDLGKQTNQEVAGRGGDIQVVFTSLVLDEGQYEFQIVQGTLVGARESTAEWVTLKDSEGNKTRIEGQERTGVRRSFESDTLAQNFYRIRVKRDTEDVDDDFISDDVRWTDVVEIVADDVHYNHTAYFALEVRLSDQLNALPKITALVKGRKLNVYDIQGARLDNTFTANPAWVVADMLLNQRYGAGYERSRIDWPTFVEWADYCDAEGLEFNGPFDYHTNLWDGMQEVFRVGQANIVFVGTKISVVIEKDDPVEMIYGSGNILEGSFNIEWLPLEDRATEMEITYFDKDDDYRSKTLRVSDFDELAKGRTRRTASFTMLGVTDIQKAQYYCDRFLAKNRLIHQKCNFDVPLEAIAAMPGKVVGVQYDMPSWGTGGRLETGSTDMALNLDTPVDMESGKSYRVQVHLSAVKRWDATVETISVGSIFVSGVGDALRRLHRMKMADGTDIEILKVIDGSPYAEIVLDYLPLALSTGQSVELWDTEVIKERDVDFVEGQGQTSLTLSTALSQAPITHATFMFGEVNKITKPFRIISISRDDEFRRSIRVIEHVSEVYASPGARAEPPNYSSLDLTIGHVTDLEANEELIAIGNVVQTRVHVSWGFPDTGLYEGAEVFVARNGGLYFSEGTVHGRATNLTFTPPIDGEELTIKVVAFDGAGARPSFDDAPAITHTVVGKLAKPARVENFAVAKTPGGIKFTWDEVDEADILGYEIREGASWDAGAVLVGKLAATQFITTKSDSGTYIFHIKAIDTGKRYSEMVSSVILSLPAPASVSNFVATQHGEFVQLSWDKNSEPDIAYYEIREGSDWQSGKLTTRVATNTWQVPVIGSNTNRYFWIKAVDVAGIPSAVSVFVRPKIVERQIKNVVYTTDEHDGGYAGVRVNMETDADGLIMTENAPYGEYLFAVDIGAERFARCLVDDVVNFVIADSPTWKEMTFTWNDAAANNPWVETGDASNMTVARQIAMHTGVYTGIDAIALNDDAISINAVEPAEEMNIAYTAGRFKNGALVSHEATKLSWAIAVPLEFSLTFWVRPKVIDADTRYLTLEGAGSISLSIDYDALSDEITLTASDANDIVITPPVRAVDQPFLVVLVQSPTARKIFVADVAQNVVEGSGAYAPLGAFSTMKLY